MKIYNSLTTSYRTLPPTTNSPLGTAWYVCGPTVYDSAHLGHGRTYVSLDILRRVALNLHDGSGGKSNDGDGSKSITPRPLYVMNITDVDDKIIQRSIERVQNDNGGDAAEADPLSLARYYEHEFWQDMDALNVMRPDVICRVSEQVDSTIVPYIQQIVDGGMAYVIPEEECSGDDDQDQLYGSVYFDVRAFESITNGRTKYGKLAPDVASTDFFSWEPEENEGNDERKPIRKKRDPRDFCLWKHRPRSSSSSSNSMTTTIEPESVSYTSPWGPGRPGWHVECSAMIERLARDFQSTHEFAVHAGGVDLKFPHHSNEIAQAEAFMSSGGDSQNDCSDNGSNGFKEWIPHWIHTGHLYVKGRKMSKSLKNFVTIREMLVVSDSEETGSMSTFDKNNAWSSPADDFRLWCLGLSGAYRGPATYSNDRMEEARVIREKWIRFLMEGQECLDRWTSIDNCNGTANMKSSRLWGDEELEMFHTATQCSMNCRKALLDDLDGSSFVKELTRIADTGLAYVELAKSGQSNQLSKNRAEEPLRFVLDTLRGQLELVGFTQQTVNAGISHENLSSSGQPIGAAPSTNNALIDEAVAFRAAVRSAALGTLRKKKDGLDTSKEILSLCDALRDDIFPTLGIEIIDSKVVHDKNDEGDVRRGWRRCAPRRPETDKKV